MKQGNYGPFLAIIGTFIHSSWIYDDLPQDVPLLGVISASPIALPWGAFHMPAICLVVLLLFRLLVDTREQTEVRQYLAQIWFALSLVLAGICVVAMTSVSGVEFSSDKVAWLAIGVMLIVAANSIGKLPPNAWAGIRNKWTRGNPKVWLATNRFGGTSGVMAGILMIIVAIAVDSPGIPLLLLAVGILVSIVTLQSWRFHRQFK
ncbi:MAG: SdpI family protein [Pseudomonadota bacterium]